MKYILYTLLENAQVLQALEHTRASQSHAQAHTTGQPCSGEMDGLRVFCHLTGKPAGCLCAIPGPARLPSSIQTLLCSSQAVDEAQGEEGVRHSFLPLLLPMRPAEK